MQAPAPTWRVTPQPGYQINSTAISADGQACLLGTSKEYASGLFAIYGYDGKGNERWHDPLQEDAYQGVFWVALSADGRYGAAGGTCAEAASTPDCGFLRAYRFVDGDRLLDVRLDARVNQVALSDDGTILAAVAGKRLHVYRRDDGDAFRHLASHTFPEQYCETCALGADGRRVVVGTTGNSGADGDGASENGSGSVAVLAIAEALHPLATCTPGVGVLRVDMLPEGDWWAAACHDGSAIAFNATVSLRDGTPAWTWAPSGMTLGAAYGVALATGENGDIQLVCSANLPGKGHGCVYAVGCARQGTGDPPRGLWLSELSYNPNPGLSMDRHARYVSATDGQPTGPASESAGNFYLFRGHDGATIWNYPTPLMNWPMAVSADGHAAFGASDDGSAYYWVLG